MPTLTPTGPTGSTALSELLTDMHERYGQVVFKICFRITKNREAAQDLSQDVFLKIFRHYGEFRGQCQTLTWIYRIAVNESLNHLQAKRRESGALSRLLEETQNQPVAPFDDCENDRHRARKILEGADHVTRRVLDMYFTEGFKQGEIAKILGVSRVAVTKRLSRMRSQVACEMRIERPVRRLHGIRIRPARGAVSLRVTGPA